MIRKLIGALNRIFKLVAFCVCCLFRRRKAQETPLLPLYEKNNFEKKTQNDDWTDWAHEQTGASKFSSSFMTSASAASSSFKSQIPPETAKLTSPPPNNNNNNSSILTPFSSPSSSLSSTSVLSSASSRPAARSSGALLNSYFRELEPSIRATKKIYIGDALSSNAASNSNNSNNSNNNNNNNNGNNGGAAPPSSFNPPHTQLSSTRYVGGATSANSQTLGSWEENQGWEADLEEVAAALPDPHKPQSSTRHSNLGAVRL